MSGSDLRQRLGAQAEQAAHDFLVAKGYRCRERNFRMRGGEVDLIMEDGLHLVFIEVKHRRSFDYGAPEEAVTALKIRRITKTAVAYITKYRIIDRMVRFDVVTLDDNGLRHWPNAFEAVGDFYF